MVQIISRLEELLEQGAFYMQTHNEEDLALKPSENKWSKKEILGHLIDSGINNLQRFTEITFEDQPYKIRNYKQDDLVRANKYQQADSEELLNFWLTINTRIIHIINSLTYESFKSVIQIDAGHKVDLKFIIVDYVDHLEHHLNQIIKDAPDLKN